MSRPAQGIYFRRQPTNHSCGQTCVAMLADCSWAEACSVVGTTGKTSTAQVVNGLHKLGINSPLKRTLHRGDWKDLPRQTLLINVSRKVGKKVVWRHWAIYHAGQFYDPDWGIAREWPVLWAGAKVRSYLLLDIPRLRKFNEKRACRQNSTSPGSTIAKSAGRKTSSVP